MLALGIADNPICSYKLALSIMGVQCKVCTEERKVIGSLKSKGLILRGACICLANIIKKNYFHLSVEVVAGGWKGHWGLTVHNKFNRGLASSCFFGPKADRVKHPHQPPRSQKLWSNMQTLKIQ